MSRTITLPMADADARAADDGISILHVIGSVIPLVTALLPVAGFIVRLCAFGSNATTSGAADTLAWSAPISQLAWTGLPTGGVTLAIVALAGLSEAIHRSPPTRRPVEILEGAFIACATVVVVVWAPWPFVMLLVLMFPFAIAVGLWARRLRRAQRQMTYRHGWLLALPVLLVSSAAAGFSGTPVGTTSARYTFAVDSRLPGGQFAQLGGDGSVVFLGRCGAGSSIDAVNRSDIVIASDVAGSASQYAPSLVGMAFEHQQPDAGYQPPC
jgi:hypothetical protein